MDLSERSDLTTRHPWEIVRAQFFLRVLRQARLDHQTKILDIGAGDSWFGAELARTEPSCSVVCWDTAYTDPELADPPMGVTRTRDAPPGTFDVVLLMDVLEHIENADDFLVDVVQPRMADGGIIIASVPAHAHLFSSHDEALGHYRRYAPSDFVDRVSVLGEVVSEGPLFISLTLPRAGQVAIERMRPNRVVAGATGGIGSWQHGRVLTFVVRSSLMIDAALCRLVGRVRLPLRGLSHWAVIRTSAR